MLSNAAYFSKTFFTSPILRWILPPAFSAVPRWRKSESPAASPVFSFTFPFASLIRPLILSLVLDFTRKESALVRILDVDLRRERFASTTEITLSPANGIGVCADWIWPLELDVYLDAAQTPLKVPKHFVSAICSLINSPSKLCRVDGRAAKGTLPTLSFEPFNSFLDLLATFQACNFQR
jgi:hypothetical protein